MRQCRGTDEIVVEPQIGEEYIVVLERVSDFFRSNVVQTVIAQFQRGDSPFFVGGIAVVGDHVVVV